MMRNIHKTVAIVAVIAALTSGCRSTDEYKKLAEAGKKYTHAVDQLLTTASNMRINTTSEQILESKRNSTTVSLDDYEGRSQTDEELLEIINELRNHNQLLQAYFSKLQELAYSDAPDRAAIEISDIADNLNASGKKLLQMRGNLIPNEGVFSGVTKLILDSRISGALREELDNRKDAIFQELTLQEQMLEYIGNDMQKNVEEIKRLQEQRLVIQPFVQSQPIQDEDEWIQTRNRIITMEMKIEELYRASRTLGEFKEIFQACLQGKSTLENLNNFLSEIDSFLAIVSPNN